MTANRTILRTGARVLALTLTLTLPLAGLGGGLVASPAAAQEAPPAAAKLDQAQQADLKRISEYLNGITTLQARFIQIASNGSYAEGNFFLSRPGRLRIEYDPPVQQLIVADGSWLIYYDKKLDEVSYLGLDSTPAGIFLRKHIDMTGDGLVVTGLSRDPGVIRVGLVQKDDPLSGHVTLVFADKPLALRKWIVVDAQGVQTTVALLGVQTGIKLDPKLFKFVQPNTIPGDG